LTFIEIVDIIKGNNTIGKIMKAKIPVNCLFQGCYNPEYEEEIKKCKDKCFAYNQLNPNDRETQEKMLRSMLGKMGKEVIFTPPFWCDYGYNISVGDYFYSNHNLIITDGAEVTFGDNVFIAPNCCFTTAEHPIDPEQRKSGLEIAKPITIGNNVWIGAGSTILAGVNIGDNTVIGAGSVVTKSIPDNVVAVGIPCKVVRKITQEEKYRYPMYNEK
jgi:maltose O-acetyltransferase